MTLSYQHSLPCPADNIVEYIAAHKDALKILESQLPIQCEAEGHRWSEPVRERVERGHYEIDRDFEPRSFCQPAPRDWICDGFDFKWIRTCSRCGKKDERWENVKVTRSNPFEEPPNVVQ